MVLDNYLSMTTQQDPKSNRYDSILQWLQTEKKLMQTHSYPKSSDAHASKNDDQSMGNLDFLVAIRESH